MSDLMDPRSNLVDGTRAALTEASTRGDEERLRVLDELYRSLERELERDLDQAGSPRL